MNTLHYLVYWTATKKLQKLFLTTYKTQKRACWQTEGATIFANEEEITKHLNQQQRTTIQGSTENWDLSLLATIFLKSKSELVPVSKMGHIAKLQHIRNLIAHNGTLQVTDYEYEALQMEIKQILIELDIKKITTLVNSKGEINLPTNRNTEDHNLDQLKSLAKAFILQGKFSEAVECFNEALKIPDLPIADHKDLLSKKEFANKKLLTKAAKL